MIKLFDKISDKEKNKLINYLEGLYYTFKKNDNNVEYRELLIENK